MIDSTAESKMRKTRCEAVARRDKVTEAAGPDMPDRDTRNEMNALSGPVGPMILPA